MFYNSKTVDYQIALSYTAHNIRFYIRQRIFFRRRFQENWGRIACRPRSFPTQGLQRLKENLEWSTLFDIANIILYQPLEGSAIIFSEGYDQLAQVLFLSRGFRIWVTASFGYNLWRMRGNLAYMYGHKAEIKNSPRNTLYISIVHSLHNEPCHVSFRRNIRRRNSAFRNWFL